MFSQGHDDDDESERVAYIKKEEDLDDREGVIHNNNNNNNSENASKGFYQRYHRSEKNIDMFSIIRRRPYRESFSSSTEVILLTECSKKLY